MDEDLVDIILQHRGVEKALATAFSPHKDDLERLVTLLNLTGAKSVLEFGSGWSTAVLALWVNRHHSFFESLEADPWWYATTFTALRVMQDIAPRCDNDNNMVAMYRTNEYEPQERYHLLFSPVANGRRVDGLLFLYHILMHPDFIYVDGPALVGNRILVENIYALDKAAPMAFLVDGRWPQAWAIMKGFPEYTALISTDVSFICHERFTDAIEWFKSTVNCVINPTSVVL